MESLRGQGPSLQILAVSGLSSWQTPKLSSTVRQSTGRSWVPLPQVTEHYRGDMLPVRDHLPCWASDLEELKEPIFPRHVICDTWEVAWGRRWSESHMLRCPISVAV